MTIFIRWPITKDREFRKKYLAATGEAITNVMVNAEQTEYMVGSSRIKQLSIFNLRLLFPLSGIYFGEVMPNSWVDYEPEGIV